MILDGVIVPGYVPVRLCRTFLNNMFDFLKGKKKVEKKPVYVINGFLDSGKTSFIAYTIGQPYFQTRGTTLLILCEEGEGEYREGLLKETGTVLEIIEDLEDFTTSHLMELEKKYQLTIGIPSSDPERMYQTIKNLVSTDNLREIYQTRRQRMLEDKIDVATFFSQFIEKMK